MGRLTGSNVEKKPSSNKNIENGKITHLFLNEKRLKSIGNLSVYKNLKVLYLQNNYLKKLDNLHCVTTLTHLYVQKNNIAKMENLENLKNLEKLYLGCNKISVVEGLENLEKLTELHVENQLLEAGECLYFEPRTLQNLFKSLTFLNVTGNGMKSLGEIRGFCRLQSLKAENNSIENVEDLTDIVGSLSRLAELSLQGNPVTQTYRYRENLIANSSSCLNILDGKPITESCRDFMKRFKHEKQLQLTKKQSKTTLSEDITTSLNLPLAFKLSVSRAMSQQFNPKFAISTSTISGELQPHILPHWKSAPSIATIKDDRYMPRPFWKSVNNFR